MSTSLCLAAATENARVWGCDTRLADRAAVRMNSGANLFAMAAVIVEQWQSPVGDRRVSLMASISNS